MTRVFPNVGASLVDARGTESNPGAVKRRPYSNKFQ